MANSSYGMTDMCAQEIVNKAPAPIKAQTVKEYYDEKIAHSRKTTEQLCIAKAKMEVLGLLDYPHQELQNLIGGWFN